jgi:phosphatidyl-myo-inositol dimannoside synthase
VRRTLLVTNDFPPRAGGIQHYLHTLAMHLPEQELVVYAPSWESPTGSHPEFDAKQPFTVVRHPTSLMLPVPSVAKRAKEIARAEGCDTVWFGASAPLGLLAPALRRAGVDRFVASTHGHEVGWAMLPGAHRALRRIGSTVDVLTFVSRYTRSRFAAAFGPMAALEYLPSGVDTGRYRPDPAARAEIRARHGLGDRPTVVCVSRMVPRKGQDMLILAMPKIRELVPGAVLLLVGGGPNKHRMQALADSTGVGEHVIITGSVPFDELPAHYVAGDVFAMPCRTRGGGLDVEALGLVFLEASASGLPVVVGDSGGSPETVREGETGHVVSGRDLDGLAQAVGGLLADPDRAAAYGAAGRTWVQRDWRWEDLAARLAGFLNG